MSNKRIVSVVILLAIILAACSSPTLPGTPISSLGIDWNDRSIFRDGLVQSEQGVLDQLPGASVYHIDLSIADDMTHVSGVEEVRYTNQETAALDEIQFRLFPNLLGGSSRVSLVTVDGQPVTPTFGLEDSLMHVPLAASLQPGQSVTIHVEFAVTVPTELEKNYGILVYNSEVLALAHIYPMIAVYDDEGWNAEIPPQQGDVVYNDACFYVVSVDAPAHLVMVASGGDIAHSESGGRQQVQYAAGPARDFYLVASPDYVKISKTDGEITVNSYAPGNRRDGSQMALDVAAAALQDFSQRYAPYPYTEFDIAAIPTLALGIEFPGMTAISQDLYDLSGVTNGTPMAAYLESTVAHETGHQWFYNLVGDDQLDEPWLDESLAQYITWQYYRDRYGEGAAQGFEQALRARWDRVDGAKIPIGLPVRDYVDRQYGAIVYGRGAFFFEALDEQMGQATFDQFMRDYTGTYSWGVATTEGMKHIAEQDCGCDLTPLFEEWVYP